MKYLKNFPDHTNYNEFIVGSDFKDIQTEKKDVVSYCKNQSEIHYNPYIPHIANFLDILYSDTNGNLSFTSEVLPVSEGKTPIGLCIAGTGFFGTNEPARWMSLKYMSCTTPDTGSLTSQGIYWGNYENDISTIDNIQTTYNGGSNYGYLSDFDTSRNPLIPSLFDLSNNWNISVLGTVNQYAVTDIDGKNKTDKILAAATAQSTWQTDTTIINSSDVNYAPAACCCWRYHTLGTQQGDWYLGASGELCMLFAKKTDIDIKLDTIRTIYTNECIRPLYINNYWSSTEYGNNYTYSIYSNTGDVHNNLKTYNYNVIAMLQY